MRKLINNIKYLHKDGILNESGWFAWTKEIKQILKDKNEVTLRTRTIRRKLKAIEYTRNIPIEML